MAAPWFLAHESVGFRMGYGMRRASRRQPNGSTHPELVVAKLDRLTRSVMDAAQMIVGATEEGWGVVLRDIPGADTSKDTGRLMIHLFSALAEFERSRISTRQREACAQKRARGERMDNLRNVSPDLESDIRRWYHDMNLSLAGIKTRLEAEGILSPSGGDHWARSTIHTIVHRPEPVGGVWRENKKGTVMTVPFFH